VSISFYGKKQDDKPIMLDIEHPAYVNLNFGSAYSLLRLLGLPPGEDYCHGEVTMPEARRGVILARATFERRAPQHTRPDSDTKRPGRPRVIEGSLDEGGLKIRLDMFERFLNVVTEMGATSIYWA
jgi:hypothetical protein